METIFLKKEENVAKRIATVAGEDTSGGTKISKRRRREPPATVVAANGNREAPEQPTTGSTIKRSSKYRGVSRYLLRSLHSESINTLEIY